MRAARSAWLALALVGCASSSTVRLGDYQLVGARVTTQQGMEPWAGDSVGLTVAEDAVTLGVGDVRVGLMPTRWDREAWVEGCWSMKGMVAQEVWTLACDEGVDLGGGVAAQCPLALIAACPDGRTLFIREIPGEGESGTGCGGSGVCFQFEPVAR